MTLNEIVEKYKIPYITVTDRLYRANFPVRKKKVDGKGRPQRDFTDEEVQYLITSQKKKKEHWKLSEFDGEHWIVKKVCLQHYKAKKLKSSIIKHGGLARISPHSKRSLVRMD